MPFTVVLDTCVIYPAHLRDTLLRQAERGLYRALCVLAAAVRADAAAIVTFNTRDFPAASVDSFEIDIISPDTLLLDQLDLAPSVVIDELRQQAAANKREPKSLSGLLDALTRAGAPSFADEVRRRVV